MCNLACNVNMTYGVTTRIEDWSFTFALYNTML